jgi:UDP-N-acetylglucosamine--N-acetylmuramyl-(pentapeptide) pyrophosphoryl-undecaprenol N-acetylglucosamine transferase
MTTTPTILMAGGGTGGHLYPGVAVAEAIRQRTPEARIIFLCTQRDIDRVILAPTGFEFIEQPIVPPVRTVMGLVRFWRGWRATKDLVRGVLKDRKPAVVLGLGGYAAGVAVKLAAKRGIPTAILNPDVIPGKANQYLMRYAQAVCCQFEATKSRVASSHQGKLKITGCPIRAQIVQGRDRPSAALRLGLDASLRTLVITGASQGAQTVNEGVLATLPQLRLQGWQVLHLAGRDHGPAVTQAYRQQAIAGRVIDFTPDMGDVWAMADLTVSRAGASTCAEVAACGVPSIFMPYPFHKDLHQRANAKVLADAGAAVLLDDQKEARKNAERLRPVLESLLHDADKRSAMSRAAKALGRPDAAGAVADVIGVISARAGVVG